MEDEAEVLDWGNEEDEQQSGYLHDEGREDAEDAVSLGGDEDDTQDFTAYKARSSQEIDWTTSASTPHQNLPEGSSLQSGHDRDFTQPNHATESPHQSRRSQSSSFGQLMHALPPKPVLVSPEYVRPAPPQASTLAGPMVQRDRRSNGNSKDDGHAHASPDSLPPEWEVRYPRNGGREAYYYNTKTHSSTWTRPVTTTGGGSSPSRDREPSSARSPHLNAHDRSQTSDRNLATRGRKQRRRGSPNSLTFDDRHYRPGELVASTPVSDGPEHSRPRPRQPSPNAVNGRPRSLTPPAREADRSGNARRQHSRSPPLTVHGTWREPQRDAPQSRFSPPLERDRGRARGSNDVFAEDTRSPSPDDRAQRSRRPHDSPRHHPAHFQDQSDRRGDSRDWPSAPHRYRSPSQDADARSKQNRNAQAWDSWRAPPQSGRNRPSSPPTPERGSIRMRDDVYTPLDSVPLRRGRELVSPDRDGDVDTKRRRLEGRSSDIVPGRRLPSVDRGLPSSASMPEQPLSDLTLSDEPRRKRAPLPPQSARFREAYKMPPPPLVLPMGPSPQTTASNSSPYLTPRSGPDSGNPTRSATHTSTHSYVDVPSGPRNAIPQSSSRDYEGTRGPPSRLSGRPSRFDSVPQLATNHSGALARDRDVMDVDYSSSSAPPYGRTEGIPRLPGGYPATRTTPNDVPSGTPRAPKAMTGSTKPVFGTSVSSAPSSAASDVPRTPITPLSAPVLRDSRALPPHMTQERDVRSRRDDDLPPRSANSITSDVPARAYDDAREYGPDAASSRVSADSLPMDSRGGRDGYRRPNAGLPSPRSSFSGSNSTPIGTRRAVPNALSLEAPRQSRSPMELHHPLSDQASHDRSERGRSRYSDDAPSQQTSPRESPGSQYRALPPINDSRHALLPHAPTPTFAPSVSDATARRGRQDERASRQTRFGSEQKTPNAPDSQPRIWLTREESQRAERARHAEVAPKQSSVPRDESLASRHASMDVDEPPRRRQSTGWVRGTTPPRGPKPGHHYDRRPSLEGRLSSTYDLPPHDQNSRNRVRSDVHLDDHDRLQPELAPTKLHPERLRLLEPQPVELPSARDSQSSHVSRGSGRRSQRDDPGESVYSGMQHNGHTAGDDHYEPERPPGRRGTSLLERLSGGASGSSAQATLRDRVDSPTKRPVESEFAGLPPKPSGVVGDDLDSDISGRGARNRKKGGKPKRGRKIGAA